MENEGHTLDEWMQKLLPYVLLIFTLLILAGVSVECKASIHENLEYHKTNFTSNEWFDVMQNVVINTTIGKMYLNETASIPYEDFTTWTETDPDNKFTETETRITFSEIERDDITGWVYKDKGDELNDFTRYFELCIDSITSSSSTTRFNVWTISEYLDDYTYLRLNNYEAVYVQLRSTSSTTNYRLGLIELKDGATDGTYSTTDNDLDVGTLYYLKIVRLDDAVTLYV